MSGVSLQSPIPRRQLKGFLRQIPSFLSGRSATSKAQQYQRLFLSAFTQELYSQIYAAYLVKSRGDTDELGTRWRPLAESTIRRKLAQQNKRQPGEYDLLSTKEITRWKKLQTNFTTQLQTGGMSARDATHKARSLAWQRIRQLRSSSGGDGVPIGIDSGDLIESNKPGELVDGKYVPSKGQIFKPSTTGVTLGSRVKHASHFHRKRKIWPGARKMKPWLTRAARAGLTALRNKLAQDIANAK